MVSRLLEGSNLGILGFGGNFHIGIQRKFRRPTNRAILWTIILSQSGQNPGMTFLVANKIFLLSEDEISWEYFMIILWTCKPWENIWNCSRKYSKMFKTDFIFRQQKKSSLNQNIRCDHVTMKQDVLLHFRTISFIKKWSHKNMKKKKKLLSSTRAF